MLKALNQLYDRLSEEEDFDISPPGFSSENVSHVFIIDKEGELVGIQALNNDKKKQKFILPQKVIRTSTKTVSNLLYENISYFLGVEEKKISKQEKEIKISMKKYEAFKERNQNFLKDIDALVAKAICNFLDKWNPKEYSENEIVFSRLEELFKGYNFIFKLNTDFNFAHEDEAILKKLSNKTDDCQEDDIIAQCLVTGKDEVIERLHMSLKSISGATPTGALLVSFNQEAFESYGKKQGTNAPVGKTATFKYGTALTYLNNSSDNKIVLGDMTIFFWAERKEDKEMEKLISFLLDLKGSDDEDSKNEYEKKPQNNVIDNATARKAKSIITRLRNGLPIGDTSISENSKLYILGIVGNRGRLSVRFWQNNSFEEIVRKMSRHFEDLDVIGLKNNGFISPYQVLINMAILSKKENIQPQWNKLLLDSIINGKPYSPVLYHSMLEKCLNAGKEGGVNSIRVAFIKAYLKRYYRSNQHYDQEEMITVALNKDNKNIGYLLGRLFYTLEYIQNSANPSIERTIADSFLGSAVRAPGQIFNNILMLSTHHMSKLHKNNTGRAIFLDRQKQEILNDINEFPSRLSIEDQGMFLLGYYHQKQERYTSKSEKTEELSINEDENII